MTHGGFKIDSEIQLQAKPSMMTPGGSGGQGASGSGPALPAPFRKQLKKLTDAYDNVTKAVKLAELVKIREAFDEVGKALNGVDASGLSGDVLMAWNDLAMLFNNDFVEGREIERLKAADRVYLLLTEHIQRMRRQFGMEHEKPEPKRIDVPAQFQVQLGRIWQAYVPMQLALAGDSLPTSTFRPETMPTPPSRSITSPLRSLPASGTH